MCETDAPTNGSHAPGTVCPFFAAVYVSVSCLALT